nr:immunoglobulin heavy chain junction region [Macaca mulatta]MOV49919.1 immunoglobulin heavy chain junction region [Macaca mulatta]
CARLQSNFDFW